MRRLDFAEAGAHAGDWKVKNKKGQPGGWYFEFNNEFYPDVDDTAMVCLGLSHVGASQWPLPA